MSNAAFFWEKVAGIANSLPAVREELLHGTPAFYVDKKFFARLKEDGLTLVVYNNEREEWIESDPDTFFFTDHYKNYAILLVDLKKVSKTDLQKLVINSWRIRAPKKILKAYDTKSGT